MKRGVPPTALKARTGELTPPGMGPCARSNSVSDLVIDQRPPTYCHFLVMVPDYEPGRTYTKSTIANKNNTGTSLKKR